jgi:pantetheine-phosphate adenylyltransferase
MGVTGFFAGSFDPPTCGHVDLATRALSIVDKLVVGVGRNADKSPWMPLEERLELLREVLPAGVEVQAFDGLAVTAARAAGATLLVRGVRGGEDAAGELQMSRANKRLDDGVETVLLPASAETSHISSRLVREVHRSGGDVAIFVPAAVARALAERPPGR